MIVGFSNTSKFFFFLIFCVAVGLSSDYFYSNTKNVDVLTSAYQTQKDSLVKKISDEITGDSVRIEDLGKLRIIEMDGSIKKNVIIKEIHTYWIVYEKEASLHDFLITSIERIEMEDYKNKAIYFDKRGIATIKRIP